MTPTPPQRPRRRTAAATPPRPAVASLKRGVRRYSNRSGTYLAMGHISKAFKDAEEAVKLKPDWPKALMRRAQAEHGLTRYATAQATWRKAIALDPENKQRAARVAF